MVEKFIKKVIEILSVFVLLWILAGSLIEFHQRFVFHENADIWAVQATQVKTDTKKVLQLQEKSTLKISLGNFVANEQHNGNGLVTFQLCEKSIFSRYLFDLLTPEFVHERSLRGPPLV
jgi:hypothetical protein